MAQSVTVEESNGRVINTSKIRTKFHSILSESGTVHIGETMNNVSRSLVLGMLGGFHTLLFGPPGCNKSGVIRDMYSRVLMALYFELLSSLYATKEDLVGPIDMAAMDAGIWRRNYKGRAPEAHLMYVDETLECPDGLLKEMHPIMNERVFHNGAKVIPVPLISMAGATNADPEDVEGREAFLDRFLMRFLVGQVSDISELKAIRDMNQKKVLGELATATSDRTTITLEELQACRSEVDNVVISDSVNSTFGKIYKKMKTESINITNRRAVECDRIIRASAWLRGSEEAETEDMSMLTWALWQGPKDVDVIVKMLAEYAKDAESRARELLNAVKSAKRSWDSADDRKKREELQLKAKSIIQKMNFLMKQKKNEGKTGTLKVLMEAYKEASSLVRDMNSHP